MDISVIHFLTSHRTHHELALRSQGFLRYNQEPPGSENRQLAEDTFFNLMVEYIIQAGMPRSQAERFCENPDNLLEMAMRLNSVLGWGL